MKDFHGLFSTFLILTNENAEKRPGKSFITYTTYQLIFFQFYIYFHCKLSFENLDSSLTNQNCQLYEPFQTKISYENLCYILF